METNNNEHLFVHQIATIQGFLVESPYIQVKIFVWVLLNAAKVGGGKPGFDVEKLCVELGDDVRLITYWT